MDGTKPVLFGRILDPEHGQDRPMIRSNGFRQDAGGPATDPLVRMIKHKIDLPYRFPDRDCRKDCVVGSGPMFFQFVQGWAPHNVIEIACEKVHPGFIEFDLFIDHPGRQQAFLPVPAMIKMGRQKSQGTKWGPVQFHH